MVNNEFLRECELSCVSAPDSTLPQAETREEMNGLHSPSPIWRLGERPVYDVTGVFYPTGWGLSHEEINQVVAQDPFDATTGRYVSLNIDQPVSFEIHENLFDTLAPDVCPDEFIWDDNQCATLRHCIGSEPNAVSLLDRIIQGQEVSNDEIRALFPDPTPEQFLIQDLLIELNVVRPQGGWDLLGIHSLSNVLKEGIEKVLAASERINPNISVASTALNNLAATGSKINDSFITWFQKPAIGSVAAMVCFTILEGLKDHYEPSTLRIGKILVAICALTYVSADYIKPLFSP